MSLDVDALQARLRAFAAERQWQPFHTPKNLAMALMVEAAELTEIFQWMTEDASKEAARNPETAQAVKDELADVLMYVVRLASVLGVDLNEAAQQKLKLNGEKYPVAKAWNTSKKYDQI